MRFRYKPGGALDIVFDPKELRDASLRLLPPV